MARNPFTSLTSAVPPRAALAAGGALVTVLAAVGAASSPAPASAAAQAARQGAATRVLPAAGRVQPRAAIGNPVAGNEGFLVFVHHDAEVNSNENEGTMALGGNLLLNGDYRVANHPPTHPFVDDDDAQPTGLLVGGRVDWANSSPTGRLQVLSQAYVKLGDSAGTDVVNTTSLTELVPSGAGADSPAHVILTTAQPEASVLRSDLIDFDGAFSSYETRSAEMADCDNTVVPADAAGNPLSMPWPSGTQVYLTLSTTETNVWHVSTSQLAAVSNITLRNLPTAAGPLVINVTDDSGTGDFNWNVPPLANFSATAAPYVLWNFPDTTNLTLTGGDSIDGTVYAPRAHLVDLDSGNIQGNVIVSSLVHGGPDGGDNGGEMHDFPFAGDVECGGAAPTTEPPTTEPPTTEPPTTEAPTTEPPTTEPPTTEAPTTEPPTTEPPTTEPPTTEAPTTEAPTTEPPTTEAPTTAPPTTEPPTTEAPTTAPPTTEPPTTEPPTTEPPTTAPPTTEPPTGHPCPCPKPTPTPTHSCPCPKPTPSPSHSCPCPKPTPSPSHSCPCPKPTPTKPGGLASTGVDYGTDTLLVAAGCIAAGLLLTAASRRRKNQQRHH